MPRATETIPAWARPKAANHRRRDVFLVLTAVVATMLIMTSMSSNSGGPAIDIQPLPTRHHSPQRTSPHSVAPLNRLTAVLILPDITSTENLVPLLLHFSSVLGPAWSVVLYTIQANWAVPSSASMRRALDDGQVQVRFLPPEFASQTNEDVSAFLATPWLWSELRHADRVLTFQLDTIICSKSPYSVDDFLRYDFIGAAYGATPGSNYGGGLSLRNPKLMLAITQEAKFSDSDAKQEDQWFVAEAKARGARLPDLDVSKTFVAESVAYLDQPFGLGQPQRWHTEKRGDMQQYCPEAAMIQV
jgi:hypothetical protein